MSIPSTIDSSFKYNGQDYTILIEKDHTYENEKRLRIYQTVDDKMIWKATGRVIETQKNGETKTRYSILTDDNKAPESVQEAYRIALDIIKEYHAKNNLAGHVTILTDGSYSKDDYEEKKVIRNLLTNGWTFHEKTSDEIKIAIGEAIQTNAPIPNFEGIFKCIPQDETVSQRLSDETWVEIKNLPALTPADAPAFTPASNPTAPAPEPTSSDAPPYTPASDDTPKDPVIPPVKIIRPDTGKKIPVLRRDREGPGVFSKIGSAIRYIFCLEFLSDIYTTIKNWISDEE